MPTDEMRVQGHLFLMLFFTLTEYRLNTKHYYGERESKHEPLALLTWKSLAWFSRRVGVESGQNQWLKILDQRMAHASTRVHKDEEKQ